MEKADAHEVAAGALEIMTFARPTPGNGSRLLQDRLLIEPPLLADRGFARRERKSLLYHVNRKPAAATG
jgi:hypothetical protein